MLYCTRDPCMHTLNAMFLIQHDTPVLQLIYCNCLGGSKEWHKTNAILESLMFNGKSNFSVCIVNIQVASILDIGVLLGN
jgi:hypothetical protein